MVAEQARDELADVIDLTRRVNDLERRISVLAGQAAPVPLAMPGAGALTAAKIVGETAGASRFRSEVAFARHAGIAPVPVWSGSTKGRVRLSRSGTRIRLHGPGLVREEESRRQVRRRGPALPQRRIARIVFNHLTTDQAALRAILAQAA